MLQHLLRHIAVSASSQCQRLPDGTEVDVDRWKQDGVLVFPGFFSAADMMTLRRCVETVLEGLPDSRGNGDKVVVSENLADPWGRGRVVGDEPGLYTQKFDTEMIRLDDPITKRYPDVIDKIENNPKLVALTKALIGAKFSNVENMCSAYFRGMGHAWVRSAPTHDNNALPSMLILPFLCHLSTRTLARTRISQRR